MVSQRFKGVKGFPNIKQDGPLLLLQCIFLGSLVAERNVVRAGIPGLTADNGASLIQDETVKKAYLEREKLIRKATGPRHEHYTRAFAREHGIDINWTTYQDLGRIQEALWDTHRIVVFNYHSVSGLCSINWCGDEERARTIYLITDGVQWDAVNKLSGVFERNHFCPGCFEVTHSITRHRCNFVCKGCASLKIYGNCTGDLNRKCVDCNFFFKSDKCFQAHKFVKNRGQGSRCDKLKYCEGCRVVYRTSQGPHACVKESSYCSMCQSDQPTEHDCHWPEMTDKQKEGFKRKQENFRWGFFDLETTQNYIDAAGVRQWLPEHYVTTVVLIKVCSLCADINPGINCESCGPRVIKFTYKSREENHGLPPTENEYRVINGFRDYIVKDPTMSGRVLYSHNGGRFDTHLVMRSFLNCAMYPCRIINKGSTLIVVEFKVRGKRPVVFKDSFTVIPMALGAFAKAFNLPNSSKGMFPHYANMRCNWNRVWPSVPPIDDFGYKHMKPDVQKEFDEWYPTVVGRPWDQDFEILKYCFQDVLILMNGCLKYREEMMAEVGWCPFTVSSTIAGYTQFVMRADFLNALDFPYLPEAGYGSVRQSKLALLFIKWLEKGYSEREEPIQLQHAHSPHGEKVFMINGHRFSVDCYDPKNDIVFEILGDYYHGCPHCYTPDSLLVGGEESRSLLARTMERLRLINTKVKEVKFVWECEIRAMLADPAKLAMANFFRFTEIISRLLPRDALVGGRVEVMRTLLRRSLNTIIRYYDIVSMYPAVLSLREYPLGQPKVIMETNGFQFEPVTGTTLPYRGLIKCRVLAPRNLIVPVLPYRADNCLFFTLCKGCADARLSKCDHARESGRSWIGTFTTIEVERALQEGYRVLRIHEVWHWDRWCGNVYKGFFRKFMKMKYAASGFPANVITPADKLAYCEKVSRKLGFDFHPDEVRESAPRRTIAKLCNNSGWGKQAERPDHRKTEFHTCEDYVKLCKDGSRAIADFTVMSESHIMVTHRPVVESIRANRFSAVHHAAFCTSYARIMLYDIIKQLGTSIAYCDTDSVMFDHPRGADPLAHLLTGELGELSDETPDGWEIEEVSYAGCKNYSMKLVNLTTGDVKYKNAFRGFCKDAATLELLNHDTVRAMVVDHTPASLDVVRPNMKRTFGKIVTQDQRKIYQPVSKKRATRGEGEVEIKIPYGYIPDDEEAENIPFD